MKWIQLVKRKRTPLFNMLILEGLTKKNNELIKFDYTVNNVVFVNAGWYGILEELNKVREEIAVGIDKNKFFLKEMMEDAYRFIDKFNKICEDIQKKDVSKLSNQELKELVSSYFKNVLKILAYVQTTIQAEIEVTERIKETLNKKVKDEKEFQKYFLLFTSPSKIGFFEQENERLLELLKELKKDLVLIDAIKKEEVTEKVKTLFKDHLEEFAWIGNMNYNGRYWDETDLIERLKPMIDDDIDIKIKEINDLREKRKNRIKESIKKLNLGKDEIILIESIRELVYFRSYRLDVVFRSEYIIKNLFEEIANRLNLSIQDLNYLFYWEITDFLEGKEINKEFIEKRKKNYALNYRNGKLEVLYGKDIDKLAEEFKEEAEKVKEIKGSAASQGKVKGTVKVIHHISDLSKVKEGDILVATMTKPDYIIAMEKAVAFVTDEGGITCHAAIISREMNKPCIIGTKFATKVLKDGDLVEVDAETGVVKILKRK